MLKKIFASLSIFIISISSVSCSLNDTTQNLTAFYSNLEKAKFDKYDFSYTDDALSGGMIDFKNGVIGGKIDDFDNDSENELLVFRIEKNEEKKSSIITEIYEETDTEIKLMDSFSTPYLFATDLGESESFIKENDDKKYICVQNIAESTCFSDGIAFHTEIHSYNGANFENEVSINGIGSSIEYEVAYKEQISALQKIGFNVSAKNISKNFTKTEENIEKIVEFMVNTNVFDLRKQFDKYEIFLQEVKNQGKVTVTATNFTTIGEDSSTK